MFETKLSYCRVAWQGLPCYTTVAQIWFQTSRYTAVLKSNLIQSIEVGTAVARRLALASCYPINKIHLIHRDPICLDLPKVNATHPY